MEYSPKEKRGLYAAFIHVGYPTALVCIALLAALMLKVAPTGDAGSAYAVWGWRIPFIIGALLGGALFAYYYLLVPESELWRSSKRTSAPMKELFSGADLRRLARWSSTVPSHFGRRDRRFGSRSPASTRCHNARGSLSVCFCRLPCITLYTVWR